MDHSAIICNEVIKSYEKEIKTIPTDFNEKKVTWQPVKHKLFIFYSRFY